MLNMHLLNCFHIKLMLKAHSLDITHVNVFHVTHVNVFELEDKVYTTFNSPPDIK